MNNNNEQDEVIIEEKHFDAAGVVQMRKYKRGKFLGKGGFARCYEFTNIDT